MGAAADGAWQMADRRLGGPGVGAVTAGLGAVSVGFGAVVAARRKRCDEK